MPLGFYQQLRKESIVHGVKGEFSKLESLVRLGFIEKGFGQRDNRVRH